MRLGSSKQPKRADTFQWQHLLAWLGGICCAMVPFIGDWKIESMQLQVRQGAGYLGVNLLIGTALCALGAVVGGYWWRIGKALVHKRDGAMSVAAVVLFAVGVSSWFYDFFHAWFFYLVGGVLLLGMILALVYRDGKNHRWPTLYDFVGWMGERKAWNAAFFLLLFVVLVANNLSLVLGLDASFGEKVSMLAGRFCTQGVLVGAGYLLSEMVMRSAPKYFRWISWLVLGLFPMLIVMDQLLGMMWNRSLMSVVNALTSSGSLDLAVELKTSGLDVGPLGAWLIVGAVFALAMLLAGGCWLISKRFQMRLSPGMAILMILLCWLGVVAEQGGSSKWKRVTVWQEEHKSFNLHLGLFAPPQGVGRYRVSFYRKLAENQVVVPELAKKPDVYIFMLESTRDDAIRPDVAPFLSRFRDTECQPFDGTWAASNATHLSWFAFFHSRVPLFWREALDGIPDRKKFNGAVPLQQLKQAGYDIEVRAVCDFEYKDFGLSNFGYEKNLAVVLDQARNGNDLDQLNIGERERVTFERLRQAVMSRPDYGSGGGGFYYTALDSPHYNYYWHNDFDPPFKEYDKDTRFPLNPSKDEVQRVVNRYWNSVAWVDFQIEEFCDFLKAQGRYDESIIIVTGDHGEEFQEQGSWFHCSSLRPEQTGVPILIKWPASMGRGPAQKDVSHVDVMPSLMHALGMPLETTRNLVGRNLLKADGEYTAVSSTAFVGKTGETMVFRRGGYEAVFFWDLYWDSHVPEEMILEYILDPEGNKIKLESPSEYAAELKLRFPDIFERLIKTLEVVEE